MATLNDIITEVDELKPNNYGEGVKVGWLSNLEYRIVHEIFDTHRYNEGETEVEFNGYTEDDLSAEMLVKEPYSELYKSYLCAMIDFNNGETDRYQNSMIMFNSNFAAFSAYYNRTHMPKGQAFKL